MRRVYAASDCEDGGRAGAGSAAGLMSAADKTKLDGIGAGAIALDTINTTAITKTTSGDTVTSVTYTVPSGGTWIYRIIRIDTSFGGHNDTTGVKVTNVTLTQYAKKVAGGMVVNLAVDTYKEASGGSNDNSYISYSGKKYSYITFAVKVA